MKKRAGSKDWFPLARGEKAPADVPTGAAFRPEWIDFDRGIRVGNLEPHERITRILKYRLEQEYATSFITDRWGRGVYWQWICWIPRANRDAKPVSSSTNFGCSKLFISAHRQERVFQCGLQIERGFVNAPGISGAGLRPDWDWHRLLRQCSKDSPLDRELRRLLRREGFVARLEGEAGGLTLNGKSYTSAARLKTAARKLSPERWAGFQLYYPMTEEEVQSSDGYSLVQAMMGAFAQVVPAMNLCMQVALRSDGPSNASIGANAPRD